MAEQIDIIIKEVREGLNNIMDEKRITLKQIAEDTKLGYHTIRNFVLDLTEPNSKTIRILSKYVKGHK